jgi:uncharacterized protein with HEPN domain
MSVDRPVLAWLIDAQNYACKARQIVNSASTGALDSRDCQAIRYCLTVVGEALNWVPADMLAGEPSVPWRRVIALRHRHVHGYWLIDETLVIEIARSETEALIAALNRLIDRMR